MRFYLGAGNTAWLWDGSVDVPLFVSDSRLRHRVYLRPATVPSWALDSGGFTELKTHGTWTVDPDEYARDVRRYMTEIGRLDFAAIQDWMCEPWIVAKTGLTVEEHQRRTLRSYLYLKSIAPDVPWIPVLQGWQPEEYLRHISMYEAAWVDLHEPPVVGVGSVCRRESMIEAGEIIQAILRERPGLRLHGFGVKQEGLRQFGHLLASADSMAWSFNANRTGLLLPECRLEGKHQVCNDCRRWALMWRERVLSKAGDLSTGIEQLGFFSTGLWVNDRQAAIAQAVELVSTALDDMGGTFEPHYHDIVYILQDSEGVEGLSPEQLSEIAWSVIDDFGQAERFRDVERAIRFEARSIFEELSRDLASDDAELHEYLRRHSSEVTERAIQQVMGDRVVNGATSL